MADFLFACWDGVRHDAARVTGDGKVYLTSLGLVTSIGANIEENWSSLLAGKSGVRAIKRFDASRYPNATCCAIAQVPEVSFHCAHPLDDASRILLVAMTEALGDRVEERVDAPVFLGTTLGGMDNACHFFRDSLARGVTADNLPLLKDYIPYMQARHLQKQFGFRRAPQIVSNACSSSANAVGLAWLALRSGRTERAVAAGYDIVSEFVFGGFNALRLVTPDVCRPFDPERQGMMLGDGAGVMVLETARSAKAAGRQPIAELRAYASSVEAYHVTKPHPEGEGAWAVMRDCLAVAALPPEEVSSVNAHATGTPQNDLMEAKAISRLFACNPQVTITANKGAIGHTLGAAGIVEGIFSALSIRDQVVPPTVHTRCALPELATGTLVIGTPKKDRVEHVLSTSFGFGGTNAALLFSRSDYA